MSGRRGYEVAWPYVPETLRRMVVLDIVEGIDLLQRAKPAFQVVDDGPGHKSLGAIGSQAGPPVDIMVYR